MDQPDPPQFVTGHLSIWDEDGDEDEDKGVVQDVGVVHYVGVDVVHGVGVDVDVDVLQGLVMGRGLGGHYTCTPCSVLL